MEVILLERVAKLGQMGEVVKVRDGFARNFLLKRGKALRATAENRAKYDGMKAELEANNIKAKSRSDQGRREDRRQGNRDHPPGGRIRPAVRLGLGARHRRRAGRTRASRFPARRSGWIPRSR